MIGLETDGSGRVLIPVKAVPGSSREGIAGVLGDRLKIRISAPPEGGKANQAICRLLARQLGVKRKDVEIVSGHASAEKCIAVRGIEASELTRRLDIRA